MGCSPSKGHHWNEAQSSSSDSKALMAGPLESDKDLQYDDRGHGGTVSQIECDRGGDISSGVQKKTHIVPSEDRSLFLAEVASGVCTALGKVSTEAVEVNLVPQGKETRDPFVEKNQDKTAERRPRKGRGSKQGRRKDKDKMATVCELKVDFPEPMVKAHQAAYAYLNPSISKYEALLALLDQAAHTRLSLQPMVAFMMLRYEEVTCGLEDMAADGEQMLKEHRDHLAWPCPLKNHTSPAPGNPENYPPDLMQQLLQYSTEKMRLVGDSVGELGDTTLEEAADYFSSLSELLDERMKAKKVAEGRLAQVIAHIEAAAYRKPIPEDSALHSEDSGIGAESESLVGSERHRRLCESCESAGTTCPKCSRPCDSAISTQQGASQSNLARKISPSFSMNSLDAPCATKEQTGTDYAQGSEEDEDENDDDDGNEYEEKDEKKARRRSNSSPPDPSQQARYLATTRIENPQNVEMTFKMKDAISGRIHFIPPQHPTLTSKRADSLGNGTLQWTEEEDWQPRRPQTASSRLNETRKKPWQSLGKQRRSQSAESLHSKAEDPTLLELERTQRHLSWRLEMMSKGEKVGKAKGTATLICERGRPEEVRQLLHPLPLVFSRLRSSLDRNFSLLPNHDITRLRTHSSRDKRAEKEEKEEEKKKDSIVGRGPLRANIQPSTPLLSKAEPPAFHRGRNSVKRLINSFSQRNDKQHQGLSNIQGSFSETRNCGVHITLGTENRNAVRIINGNNNKSCLVDRPEDLNVDSLPPPPPEVLMDNSFECAPGLLADESEDRLRSRGHVTSQWLRSSLPTVTALPSCGSLRRNSLSLSSARPVTQVAVVGYHCGNDALQPEVDHKNEEAATLYRQARKIIHLRHATESPLKKPLVDLESRAASVSFGGSIPSVMEAETSYANIQPPTTAPASRVRMPPCSPSNRRLPNPPSFKCQPTPPASDKPPTSPPGQMRCPSPFTLRQEEAPGSNSALRFSKATSPSASPRVERPSSPSQSFSATRSIFCHASHSPSEPTAWTTFGGCALPQPWGKPSCGGLLVSVRGPQPFVRRSQSARRSCLTLQPQPPETAIAAGAQSSGSEPNISGQKLEIRPACENDPSDSQLDLIAADRSASHPELSTADQALQCK